MSGIYGNILDHFPELFQVVNFWTLTKNKDKEFSSPINAHSIPVITLNAAGDQIKRKKLIDEWLLDNSSNDVIYSYDDADIQLGMYLTHPYTSEVNRVVKRLSYSSTGGMMIWGITRVQGEDIADPKTLLPKVGQF